MFDGPTKEEFESYADGFTEGHDQGRDELKNELLAYFKLHYKGGDFLGLGEVLRVINGIDVI